DSSQPMIRLICLKAGYENEPLECTMFCVPLSKASHLTALSYVWGDVERRYQMIVNGHLVSITVNLYSALRHLRKPTSHIVLWADAICL
ncbi:hypothetical protein F5884DRAFT_630156, partial [Xylogone sp. PMI_703]